MRRILPVLLAAACLGVLRAEEPQAPPDFGKLVSDLASPDYEVRERASEALAAAGETARATLQNAVSSKDLEVRTRAQNLLGALDAKIKEVENRDQDAEKKRQMALHPRALPINPVVIQIQAGGNRIVQLDPKDMALLEVVKGKEIDSLKARCAACPGELAAQLQVKGGVLVRECLQRVPEVPLEPNDLIVAAGDEPVVDLDALEAALHSDADALELTVYRKGEKMKVKVTLPHEIP
jgi:hypothetical protein